MNDPGLEDPISNNAKVIENQKESDEEDEADENEQAFLTPRFAFPDNDSIPRNLKVHFPFNINFCATKKLWLTV